jgi:hypothetical protein
MSLINNHNFIILFNVADEMGLDLDNLADDLCVKSVSPDDKTLWINDDRLAQLFNILWRESGDECMGLIIEPYAIQTSASFVNICCLQIL